MTIHEHIAQMLSAAKGMDWEQVVLNSGPPCFHLQNDGRFCGRAERWAGHDGDPHKFVSFHDLLRKHADALEIAVKALERLRSPDTCPFCETDVLCSHCKVMAEISGITSYTLAAINERLNRKP